MLINNKPTTKFVLRHGASNASELIKFTIDLGGTVNKSEGSTTLYFRQDQVEIEQMFGDDTKDGRPLAGGSVKSLFLLTVKGGKAGSGILAWSEGSDGIRIVRSKKREVQAHLSLLARSTVLPKEVLTGWQKEWSQYL